jgi:hypothetical protein
LLLLKNKNKKTFSRLHLAKKRLFFFFLMEKKGLAGVMGHEGFFPLSHLPKTALDGI